MQRLIVTGPCQASFEEVPTPECPADGLLVRATTSAVSVGTEIRVFRAIPVDDDGQFLHERIPFQLPTENGYSLLGEIVEVGLAVDGFTAGERVFTGERQRQFTAIPAIQAVKIPVEIPNDEAAFLNILEVAHKAIRQADPPIGGNVAIVGQGVVGLSVLAYLRAWGCRIAVVDPDESRLAISREMGADLVVATADEASVKQISDFFDGDGADVVIEATSKWAAIETAMHLVRTDGTVLVVSRNTEMPQFNPVGHPFLGKRINLRTSYGHQPNGQRWDRAHSMSLTVDLLVRKRLNIQPMITHRFRWDELPDVYRRFHEGEPGLVGAVIDWT